MPGTINMDAAASVDYMIPSKGEISIGGGFARRLLENELDVGAMRPYVGRNGKSYITRNVVNEKGEIKPRSILTNDDTNATLRTLDWVQLDEAVIKASKPRLRVVQDLRDKGLVYKLPNGIAKTVMQYQQQSDMGQATVSMDGLRRSQADRPVFSTINFPIPIIHMDFDFPLREILASRTGYSPLDTTAAELAGRRVAEQVEQLALGCTNNSANTLLQGAASYAWGGGTIQGLMNYTNRITYTQTLPTAMGWTPATTLDDVLQMKLKSQQSNHFGPWMLYAGLAWDPYLDDDYKPTYNDMSLRQRIREIDGIVDCRTVDYIPDYSLLLVQLTTDVIRMVEGMDITTVQWESHGGFQLNFKVMCVMIPQIRTDFNLLTGLVHANAG